MKKLADMSEEELFDVLLEKEDSRERSAFLEELGRENPLLHQRLNDLMECHVGAAGFLTSGPRSFRSTDPDLLASVDSSVTPASRYKPVEKLGEGGFGEVWLAEQLEPVRRQVAIKLLKPGMDSRQIVARFEAERQALAMMDHPNIARIHDGGVWPGGRPYFVMELVRGEEITRYADRNSLNVQGRLQLFIQVCHAIQHAHQKGVIHRDIKPSNILVTQQDGMPTPKVIDFGIAKALQQQITDGTALTQVQQFIGTPAYISPEQAEMTGQDIDTRADIYSLGVLLYELLVGCTPHDTREIMKGGLDGLRRTIRETDPLRPSTRLKNLTDDEKTSIGRSRQSDPVRLFRELRGDLDWIVMKCLEKDRTRRYETANALAMDLVRHLTHEPVLARPPSPAYRLKKAWDRNRLEMGAAATVMATMVMGTVVSIWQARTATAANRTAQSARHIAEEQRTIAQANAAEARQLLYAGNLNLAQVAYEQNNLERTRRLLSDSESYPEKGFEWSYWQRQLHQEYRVLLGHDGVVTSIAFTPDSRRIVTAGGDGFVKIWDVESGLEISSFRGDEPLYWVGVSPDGGRIYSNGGGFNGFKAHDLNTRAERLALNWVDGGSLSPQGSRMAVFSGRHVEIRDNQSGALLRSFVAADRTSRLNGVRYSADGRWLVTAEGGYRRPGEMPNLSAKPWDREKGAAKVWDVETEKLLWEIPTKSFVDFASISADGKRALTVMTWYGPPEVWDVERRVKLGKLVGHRGGIFAAEFSPDGRQILTGDGDDYIVKLWDTATLKEIRTFRGHTGSIRAVAFSPDGRWIATAGRDGTRIWTQESAVTAPVPQGAADSISRQGVDVSRDGALLLIAKTSSGHAGVFNFATRSLQTLPTQNSGTVVGVRFSPDSSQIATIHRNPHSTRIWDARLDRLPKSLSGKGSDAVLVAVFSPDGSHLLTGGRDSMVRLWGVEDGIQVRTFPGHKGSVFGVAFSPDGRKILSAGEDAVPRVWDTATGAELMKLVGHQQEVFAGAFSRDGKRIVTGGEESSVIIWNAETGQKLTDLVGHKGVVTSVEFSPDPAGLRVLTSGGDRSARLWDSANGRELLSLTHEEAHIPRALFFEDGHRILTAARNGNIRIWGGTPTQAPDQRQREAEMIAAEIGHRRKKIEREQEMRQRELSAAEERNQQMRQLDPGAIKEWLVLAPLPFNGLFADLAMESEQAPDESSMQPRAGDRVDTRTDTLTWKRVTLPDHRLDLNRFIGRTGSNAVGYAVTYVQSETSRSGLRLHVGCDDIARIFLNGKQVTQRRTAVPWRPHLAAKTEPGPKWIPDEDSIPGIELKAGWNTLVMKIASVSGPWEGSVWITDSAGQPLTGLRVCVQPEPDGNIP